MKQPFPLLQICALACNLSPSVSLLPNHALFLNLKPYGGRSPLISLFSTPKWGFEGERRTPLGAKANLSSKWQSWAFIVRARD